MSTERPAPCVSLFESVRAKEARTLTLEQLIAGIREPSARVRELTQQIRDAYAAAGGGDAGKKAIAELKQQLPAVTLAGVFEGGHRKEHWTTPSGLVSFDLDGLTPEQLQDAEAQLSAAPWVACCWRSPSGAGLKGAVRCDLGDRPDHDAYLRAWRAVTVWLASLGLENDDAAKDASRLAYVCHDADAWQRDAEPFPVEPWLPDDATTTLPQPALDALRAGGGGGDIERRALAYVLRIPSVQGQHGSKGLMQVVRVLHDGFALEGAALWRVLEQWNLGRANPPWNDDELRHALESVQKQPPRQPRGWLLGERRPAPTAQGHDEDATEAWTEPAPLPEADEPPPIDLQTMIPERLQWLRQLIESVAEAIQVPAELPAMTALGIASLGAARAAAAWVQPGWIEPAPLWCLPLMESGERKSAVLRLMQEPIFEWQRSELERLAPALAKLQAERDIKQRKLDKLKSLAAAAARETEPELIEDEGEAENGERGLAAKRKRKLLTPEQAEQRVAELAAELEATPPLAAPQLMVNCYTPQALRDLLADNGEKLIIIGAEADAAQMLGMRWNDAGEDINLLLSAHAGDHISVARASGKRVTLYRPAIAMALTVQPSALERVLGNRAAHERGLVARMLLVKPRSLMGDRELVPPPPNHFARTSWQMAVTALLNLPWPGKVIIGADGKPCACTSETRLVRLDDEAAAALLQLRADLEPRLRPDGDLRPISGFANKLPGQCVRIALAFALLADPQAEVIDGATMRAACAWAPWLIAHHRAVLGDAAAPREVRIARRLLKALRKHGKPEMHARDLLRLVASKEVATMPALRPSLELLAEHGYLRAKSPPTGRRGRPPEIWLVHPSLLASGAGAAAA